MSEHSSRSAGSSEPPAATSCEPSENRAVEEIELSGHIIDSLILPKVLDEIMNFGGRFEILQVQIGAKRQDFSYARLRVLAETAAALDEILSSIARHGALPVHQKDCRLVPADMDGAFPEGFYATSNLETDVRLNGQWIRVSRQEMDCGLKVAPEIPAAECVAMADVRAGDQIVVGREGVRVHPLEREAGRPDIFSFMHSAVSSEKPKGLIIRDVAAALHRARAGDGKILVVAGPAVVHTGSREYFSYLIREGFVNVLFAGNALATHDMEQSLFGTSLGISMEHGRSMEEGHEHHLRSVNRIRRCGGIRQAVEQGILQDGIMYECIQNNIPYLLAGSIRDDGPLPDVVTDVVEAQGRMREMSRDVTFALMVATTLHSVAVGNLLPARVKVVCADINPATVTKLTDRGTFQTVGLVTDVEPFLRVLVEELKALPAAR